MNTKFEKLDEFFNRIKTIGFWQRIFSWRQIRALSYEAYDEFKKLLSSFDGIVNQVEEANQSIGLLKNDKEHLIKKTGEQEKEILLVKVKMDELTRELTAIRDENIRYRQTEEDRKRQYEKDVATINAVRASIEDDRKKELEERQEKEIQRLESMKQMWARHQENVKSIMKRICQQHTIEYVNTVPFRGNPDNTIKICNEFIIFDAKSPASDNLDNFAAYIKSQAEAVKKYIKEENVRKEIFLVVPSNTLDVMKQFIYNMGDYRVYAVTIDALEPLVLTLQRIEDYEFAKELTPEEREDICSIIGKFAHMTKRRIQIDHFFAWEFLDILTKCKTLPRDIQEKVIEFEKSEKLNPPQDRRAKQIPMQELESDTGKIQKEAEAKEIVFPPSLQKNLRQLPLYEEDEESDLSEPDRENS